MWFNYQILCDFQLSKRPSMGQTAPSCCTKFFGKPWTCPQQRHAKHSGTMKTYVKIDRLHKPELLVLACSGIISSSMQFPQLNCAIATVATAEECPALRFHLLRIARDSLRVPSTIEKYFITIARIYFWISFHDIDIVSKLHITSGECI